MIWSLCPEEKPQNVLEIFQENLYLPGIPILSSCKLPPHFVVEANYRLMLLWIPWNPQCLFDQAEYAQIKELMEIIDTSLNINIPHHSRYHNKQISLVFLSCPPLKTPYQLLLEKKASTSYLSLPRFFLTDLHTFYPTWFNVQYHCTSHLVHGVVQYGITSLSHTLSVPTAHSNEWSFSKPYHYTIHRISYKSRWGPMYWTRSYTIFWQKKLKERDLLLCRGRA